MRIQESTMLQKITLNLISKNFNIAQKKEPMALYNDFQVSLSVIGIRLSLLSITKTLDGLILTRIVPSFVRYGK